MSVKHYTNMKEALQDLKARGFTANFEFVRKAFRDVNSGRTFKAGELAIVEHHRFEGASDPDEMSVIYAVESTDGIRGIVVDAFGTYAAPELGAFLTKVPMHEDQM